MDAQCGPSAVGLPQTCKKQMISCERVTGLFLPLGGRKSVSVHSGHGMQAGRGLIV